MIQVNLFVKQKYRHRPREWMYGYWDGRRRGKDELGDLD